MDLNDKRLKLTKKRIESLNQLGVYNTDELLSYYPYRYDVRNETPFETWKEKDRVTFEAIVSGGVRSNYIRGKNISSFDALYDDQVLRITIFNRPWTRNLKDAETVTIDGIYMGKRRVTAISYLEKPLSELEAVSPVYSTRAGIQQRTIRECVKKALYNEEIEIHDIVPISFKRSYKLLDRRDALEKIHFPKSMEDVRQANRTLKYEEFLKFFTSVELVRNENGKDAYKQPKKFDHGRIDELIKELPYELTPDQNKALNEIFNDMTSTHVMYRLLQGDVGCGKTLVATLAMYACAVSGWQAALLAPTEILARQHYNSINALLSRHGIKTAVLYSGEKEEEKNEILAAMKRGDVDLVIGTHSLIQETVEFNRLGLVIADEQQRFGVEQRRALREKGNKADFLLMSATPIPRTLASTLYGDMDISTIETMPPGRKPVITKLIKKNSFMSELKEVEELLAEGHQLYVICAAVEKNEEFHARAVEDVYKNLSRQFYGRYRVGILHGRMSSEEKQSVMKDFADNVTQILVSTTVVEVGMNVVNATGMIVYDSDRFGLSQLHQLRGRVQRGDSQGKCWLLTDQKDERTLERLNVLVNSSNGFEISFEDLRLRGPGDILGTRQSGAMDFILGNPIEDTKIINTARNDAKKIFEDPENPDFEVILELVRTQNRENPGLAD